MHCAYDYIEHMIKVLMSHVEIGPIFSCLMSRLAHLFVMDRKGVIPRDDIPPSVLS